MTFSLSLSCASAYADDAPVAYAIVISQRLADDMRWIDIGMFHTSNKRDEIAFSEIS